MHRNFMAFILLSACADQAVDHAAEPVSAETTEVADGALRAGLTLEWSGNLIQGQTTNVTVWGAYPGEALVLLVGTAGEGAGPCPAILGGACLDIVPPFDKVRATADAFGVASFPVKVRPTAAQVSMQAVSGGPSAPSAPSTVWTVADNAQAPLAGTWANYIIQSPGTSEYNAILNIDGDADPSGVVGTVHYPELDCGGDISIDSVDGIVFTIRETITEGTRCGSTNFYEVEYLPGTDQVRMIHPLVTMHLDREPSLTELAGLWSGEIEQFEPFPDFFEQEITLDGTLGADGRIGSVFYPPFSCGGDLYVNAIDGGVLSITEVNTFGLCTDVDYSLTYTGSELIMGVEGTFYVAEGSLTRE